MSISSACLLFEPDLITKNSQERGVLDTYLCYKCISDSFLSRLVAAEGDQETCRVCDEVREAITIERLGQILEPVMRENFGPGEEFPVLDDNDRIHYQQRGDSIAYWIQEVLGQYFDFEDEIVAATIEADDYWPPDGGEPYWEDTQDYEKIHHTTAEFLSNWHNILAEIKHNRRFFSQRAEAFFTDLFEGVEHMTLPGKPRSPVVRRLRVGSKLFRARVVSSDKVMTDMIDDPLRHIGPPTPALARPGRMNAEGISVFYGATDLETCIAEMRPAIGNNVAVIELRTDAPLRVLDFRRLEQARDGRALSFFQPDYQRQLDRREFLKILHTLISQPVVPGKEADYLITQTMAEFLSHVIAVPFDGILFKSAQHAKGVNVVLFPRFNQLDLEAPGTFPISLVKEKPRVFKTRAVSYENDEQHAYIAQDGKILFIAGEPWNGDEEF